MSSVNYDVKMACGAIDNDIFLHSKMFYNSNESVKKLLSYFDIDGKNVLSVLGSGDQAFHLINNGAKHIDLFDKDKLTIHYFYLRIWTIKYLGQEYLDIQFDKGEILELLRYVEASSQEENDAKKFWYMLAKSSYGDRISDMFRDKFNMTDNGIDDLKLLQTKLDKTKFDFYNIDITRKCDLNRKYDVIYTSNIRDWIIQKHNAEEMLSNYMSNLLNLLSDQGMVICSILTGDEDDVFREKRVFNEYFNYKLIPQQPPAYLMSDDRILGYCYTRR